MIAAALAAATTLPAALAATIVVESERRGDAIDLRASAMLNADASTAWRVLTDYDRFAEFIPDLHQSRVVARHGSTVTVEQSGQAALWLLKLPLQVTFEINEMAPDRLLSRAVSGSLRALTSSYTLTPTAAGARLEYVGHVEPGFAFFGSIEQTVAEHNIARQFQALADEIERRTIHVRATRIAPR